MKYAVLFLGIFTGVTLGLMAIAGLVWIGLQVSGNPGLWWIPMAVVVAALIAGLAVAIDYLTENRPPAAPKG